MGCVEVAFVAARSPHPHPQPPAPPTGDEDTASGRMKDAKAAGPRSCRCADAARRARAAGKVGDAFASLEAANHVAPGDLDVLAELGELAIELGDYEAAARGTLTARCELLTGTKQGDALLELADLFYDRLDDAPRARAAMRRAADQRGGTRRDSTLRLLASEASAHLAWDVATEALSAIPAERRASTDLVNLASAFVRAGKTNDAVALIDAASTGGQIDDGGKLLAELHAEVTRKAQLARTYEWRAQGAKTDEAEALRADAATALACDRRRRRGRYREGSDRENAAAAGNGTGGITEPDLEAPTIHVLEIRESVPPDDDDEDDDHDDDDEPVQARDP